MRALVVIDSSVLVVALIGTEEVLGKIQTPRANLHVAGSGRRPLHRILTIEDSRDDDRSDPPRWCPLADGMQADLASIGA